LIPTSIERTIVVVRLDVLMLVLMLDSPRFEQRLGSQDSKRT
jgi:hypothetical protein